MSKLNVWNVSAIIDSPNRRRLAALTGARIVSNFLDLAGLVGIAILATAFGSIASGKTSSSTISLPGFANVELDETGAVVVAMAVAAVFVLKSGFSIWFNLKTSLLVAKIEAKNAATLSSEFFSRESTARKQEMSVAAIQNKFLYSCTAISDILNARVTFLAEASLILALFLVFLIVNPLATVALFGFLGLVMFVLGRLINSRIDRNSKLQLMGFEGSLSQIRDLHGIRREAGVAGVLDEKLEALARVRGLGALGYNINYTLRSTPRFVVETSLILGIFAFIAGVVVFSDLASQAVTIGVFMTGGLRVIASALPLQAAMTQIRDGSVRADDAYQELLQLNSTQNTHYVTSVAAPALPEISCRNLTFSYPGQDQKAIDQISLEIPAFSKTAIVGRSGAGKSTLFDLLAGHLEAAFGEISVSGVPLKGLIEAYPGYVGIVVQRPQLISGTLAENVSLRPHSASNIERVRECLDIAGLTGTVEQKGGLEAQVSNDSGDLSGGEIQRLGLARALYGQPKILLLDEATSALDAETEDQISKVLDKLRLNTTIVLIAHRLSTVINADKVIYLDAGKLVASGNFDELKKLVPDFAKAAELMDIRNPVQKGVGQK